MRQSFALLIFLVLSSICFASQTNAQNNSAIAAATPNPDSVAEVENVSFDKKLLILKCPWAPEGTHCSENDTVVNVSVLTKNLANEKFYYVASGGRIIGQGANVFWDLTDAVPGKYSLTVGVGNNYIIPGKTITKTIELSACDTCDPPCSCPTLKVSGATKPAKSGDTVIFSAFVSGEEKLITYKWTISGGIITVGQNTSQIMVKIDSGKNVDKVEASVEIGGTDRHCSCINTDSAIVLIEKKT